MQDIGIGIAQPRDDANDACNLCLEDLNTVEEIDCHILGLGQAMQELLDKQEFAQRCEDMKFVPELLEGVSHANEIDYYILELCERRQKLLEKFQCCNDKKIKVLEELETEMRDVNKFEPADGPDMPKAKCICKPAWLHKGWSCGCMTSS